MEVIKAELGKQATEGFRKNIRRSERWKRNRHFLMDIVMIYMREVYGVRKMELGRRGRGNKW